MSDDVHRPDNTEDRLDPHDHQQEAVEACEYAIDALHGSDLSRAHALLDEARAAVERAQHNDNEQAYRETAYDCYD